MLYYLNVIDYIQTSALASYEKNFQYFNANGPTVNGLKDENVEAFCL